VKQAQRVPVDDEGVNEKEEDVVAIDADADGGGGGGAAANCTSWKKKPIKR
jgi:hypothetical protein